MRLSLLAAVALAAPLFLHAVPGNAEALRGTFVKVGSGEADIVEPGSHTSKTIFLNACRDGCTVYPGWNDSVNDQSSIVWDTSYISEFRHSDAVWDELVACVKRVYEPYDVVITDQDPTPADHFEAIVAGKAEEIGEDRAIGGIAPGGCGITNNAITFSFANQMTDVHQMCWTVAQETAHAFGLDHAFECSDPMTYLYDCGFEKYFQDINAPCGEYSARGCYCGGSTQNSHQSLLAHFGAGVLSPPEVSITRPADGSTVRPRFPIQAEITDNVEVVRAQLWINGTMEYDTDIKPFVFTAPDGLSGEVSFEIVAFDNNNSQGSASATVDIDDDFGALGSDCEEDYDCASGLCGFSGEAGQCTQACEPGAEGSCPEAFDCLPTNGDGGVCWLAGDPEKDSGGCRASGRSGAPWMVMLALIALRRRRRS